MSPHSTCDPQVVTIGRIGVDLYPEQIGVSLAAVRTFAKSLGGGPTNVAVAAARLGRRSAVVTKVGNDGFGEYARGALEEFGVDTRWVGIHPNLRTPITFCEIYPPDRFPLLFYREPLAPDLTIKAAELDVDSIVMAPVIWTSGTALCAEPSRSAVFEILEARARRGIVIHDLDYRPQFWRDPGVARRLGRDAVRHATVALGNLDEVEVVAGSRDPSRAAHELLLLGAEIAIVKMGPRGVFALTADGAVNLDPVPVKVLNGLGAGDGFGGALCHALLSGWDLEASVAFANAAGAIVASRLACADAMPTLTEIYELMEMTHDVRRA
ncbi:MAG: 5-dehydro-2-deoxygluconokinase [Acidimicrobiales bacterium]